MATLKLKKKYTSAKAWLKVEYPEVFNRPMAIGIDKEIIKVKPDYIENSKITGLLYNKTLNTKYLRILIDNNKRYHLDGSIMGTVPEKHKKLAKKLLAERGKESQEFVCQKD
jgi:sRNA-binding protein